VIKKTPTEVDEMLIEILSNLNDYCVDATETIQDLPQVKINNDISPKQFIFNKRIKKGMALPLTYEAMKGNIGVYPIKSIHNPKP